MSGWLRCDPSMFGHRVIPRAPGVYVIFHAGRPIYVGQSTDLRTRVLSYNFRPGYSRVVLTPWGPLDDDGSFHCRYRVSRKRGDWLMWEFRLIVRLKPQFNKSMKDPAFLRGAA